MRPSRAALVVAAAAVLPRLVLLAYERGRILTAYTEKSDNFARTFVAHGTYGFIPGVPSANTQPLYGFFLIPIYWIFGRHWWSVGVAQIVVAAIAALLVYQLGRRFVSPRVGLLAAVIATLEPYLLWHDVHVNREILDTPLAVATVLLALALLERPSWKPAALLGVVEGLAILGDSRLVLLPVAVGLFAVVVLGLRDRRAWLLAAGTVVVAALVTVPWAVRNRVELGCFALTTDAKALWKANNTNTYSTLARGEWIDNVPDYPGAPPTPEWAYGVYTSSGGKTIEHVDECAQMHFFEGKTWAFWRDHPGEKLRLAGQAGAMLWDPRSTETTGRNKGAALDAGRGVVEPLYLGIVYALAIAGLLLVRRRIAVLLLIVLAYDTLAAAVFAGATRYRISWDFALVLLAAVAADEAIRRFGRRRAAAP